LLEGFSLFSLVGRFLTHMGNHVQLYSDCYGLLCLFRNTFFGHSVISRAVVVGLSLWYFHQCISEVVIGWPLCQYVYFMVVWWYKLCLGPVFPWNYYPLIHYLICMRVVPLCFLGTCYCTVGICFSSASLSYPTRRWTVTPLHRPIVIRSPVVPPCLYWRVSPYCWYVRPPVYLCFDDQANSWLLPTKLDFDNPNCSHSFRVPCWLS